MKNKVIVITGGASGIGFALAKLLASRGALLSLADIQEDTLEKAACTIRAAGGTILTHVTDVRDPAQVNTFLDSTIKQYGRIDGAANLAGVLGPNMNRLSTAEFSYDEWKFVMDVNATGMFNCLKKELQVISDGGSIVNAASVLGLRGTKNNPAYVASKHAVVGLTRCAAKDAGTKQVRVNAVAPGSIDTPMTKNLEDRHRETVTSHLALPRKGEPEEVASLIAFLLGDEAKYITGAIYSVDGGWNI